MILRDSIFHDNMKIDIIMILSELSVGYIMHTVGWWLSACDMHACISHPYARYALALSTSVYTCTKTYVCTISRVYRVSYTIFGPFIKLQPFCAYQLTALYLLVISTLVR